MNYRQLKKIINDMSDEQLEYSVLISSPDGAVLPVYGIDRFDDCGLANIALIANFSGDNDDGFHPMYIKGDVLSYIDDEDVMKYDSWVREGNPPEEFDMKNNIS